MRLLQTPLLDANYGWGGRVQLKIEIPWLVRKAPGKSAVNGLGNFLLGVKWRFADADKAGVALAFYPQVEVRTLASSVRRGLVEEHTRIFLPLAIQKNLGPFSTNLEIGYEIRRGEKARWFGGLALGREVSERVELIGEAFATSSTRFSDVDAAWNVGGRWKLGRRVLLLFSGGTGLRGFGEQPRARYLGYLGAQFLF